MEGARDGHAAAQRAESGRHGGASWYVLFLLSSADCVVCSVLTEWVGSDAEGGGVHRVAQRDAVQGYAVLPGTGPALPAVQRVRRRGGEPLQLAGACRCCCTSASVCINVELCLSLCAFVTGLEREDRGRAPRGDQRAYPVRVDVCVSRGGRRRRSRRERPPERRGVEMNVHVGVGVGGGGALCMGGEEASLRV